MMSDPIMPSQAETFEPPLVSLKLVALVCSSEGRLDLASGTAIGFTDGNDGRAKILSEFHDSVVSGAHLRPPPVLHCDSDQQRDQLNALASPERAAS